MRKKIKKFFKKGEIGYRLLILTIVYIITSLAFLTPFMTIEGANITLGIIITVVLSAIYITIVLFTIWDKIKNTPYK